MEALINKPFHNPLLEHEKGPTMCALGFRKHIVRSTSRRYAKLRSQRVLRCSAVVVTLTSEYSGCRTSLFYSVQLQQCSATFHKFTSHYWDTCIYCLFAGHALLRVVTWLCLWALIVSSSRMIALGTSADSILR